MPLEEYVAGAILGEASVGGLEPAVARRMLSLQAIAARTYGLAHRGRHSREGFDLCDRTHCQLVRMSGPAVAREMAAEAAAATRGELLVFQESIIDAVFHADCGGHTSASDAVWGGTPRQYLQAVPDTFCARRPEASWTWRVDGGDLRRALATEVAAGLGDSVARIEVLSRDVADRVGEVAIVMLPSPRDRARPRAARTSSQRQEGESTLSGTAFRAAMLRAFGPRSLRSTRFSVARDGGTFVFAGRGNGHGVGLCQAGALARLQAGQSVEDVLRHYFRGVQIQPATDYRLQTSGLIGYREYLASDP